MFPITVLKVGEDEATEMVTIHLTDVLYMVVDGTKLVFHTEEGRYYQITSIQEYEKHLRQHHFEKLDRPNLVNMRKVRKFDKNLRLVYFKSDDPREKGTPFVTVAKTKVNIVNKYLS